MSKGDLKKKVAKGAFWVALEQFCAQGVNFGMGIVLARLLTPDDYGTVALVTIFVSVAQIFVGSGLGQALVQKREIDELDVNSVFFVNLGLAGVMYAVLFLLSPSVADYYRTPELSPVLRVLSVNLLFYSVSAVQNAMLFRKMLFHLSFRISLLTAIVSASVGICLAACGWGVWSLVWSSVFGSFSGVLARVYYVPWRPRRMFSFERIRPLFRYGSRLMANGVVGAIFGNVYGIVIGRCYTRADLAYVNKGRNVPELLLTQANSSIIEVSLPALVRLQDDPERLRRAMRRLLAVAMFVVIPTMSCLALVAPRTVSLLYGPQWTPCIPYMQLACLLVLWGPIGAVNQQGLLATGRSGIVLKLGLVRNVVSLAILLMCLTQSVLVWVVVMTFLFGPFSALIDAWCGSRYVGYRMRDQLLDSFAILSVSLLSLVPAWLIGCVPWSDSALSIIVCLTSQCLTFSLVYLGISVALRTFAVREIASLAIPRLLPRFPRLESLARYLGLETAT